MPRLSKEDINLIVDCNAERNRLLKEAQKVQERAHLESLRLKKEAQQLSHEKLGEKFGVSKTTIKNYMRRYVYE